MVTVLLVLLATVTLGAIMGRNYLRGIRRPGMNAIHLLLGAASFEGLIALLRNSSADPANQSGSTGRYVIYLLGFAFFTGIVGPIWRKSYKRSGEALLVTHVGLGGFGFLLFLVWMSHR
jgi:hypothetical protein